MKNPLWENIFRRDSEKDRVLRFLKENFLFQDLSKKELNFVHDIVHVREYRPGEKIFKQGEVGVGMYIIIRGVVDILVTDRSSVTDQFRETQITRLKSGDFFGELSLVQNHGRRGATALAHEETSLIGFFKPDLLEILERNHNIGAKVVFRLAEVLGERLVQTARDISVLKKELEAAQTVRAEAATHA